MGNDAKYIPGRNPRQDNPHLPPNQNNQGPHAHGFPPYEQNSLSLSNYPHYSVPPSSSHPISYDPNYSNLSRMESAPYTLSPYRTSPTKVTILPYQGYENYSYKPHGREFPHYSKSSYSNYPSNAERIYSPSREMPLQTVNHPNIYTDYPEYPESGLPYNDNVVYHPPRLISRTIIPLEESSFAANRSQYSKTRVYEPQTIQGQPQVSKYSKYEQLNSYPIISHQTLATPTPEYSYEHVEPYRNYRVEDAIKIDQFASPQAYPYNKNFITSNIHKEKGQEMNATNSIQEATINKSIENPAYFKNPKNIHAAQKKTN